MIFKDLAARLPLLSSLCFLSSLTCSCGDDEDPNENLSAGKSGAASAGRQGDEETAGGGGTSDKPPADAGAGGVLGGAGGSGEDALYAIAAEIQTPEGDVLYLDTVRDLEAPFDLIATGIEIPNASTFKFQGEQVFVGLNDTPSITRYVLDSDGRLQEDLTLSFAGVGASSAYDYTIVSETKAYFFDTEAFKVHVWNPSKMELTGDTIDYSAASHLEEYGYTYIETQRYNSVRRGDHLFVAGGWWGDSTLAGQSDAPYPRSLVLAFNTVEDTVKVLEDERCTYLGGAAVTSEGDTYFFADGLAVSFSELPWCALVIRAGEDEFDTAFDVGEALGGKAVFEAYQGPGDVAYLTVPDEARLPEGTPREELLDAIRNDVRFWKLDLGSGDAEEIESMEHFNDVRFSFDIGDGRVLANVQWLSNPDDPESFEYETSAALYDLTSQAEPVEFPLDSASDVVRSRIAEIARLR